MRRFGLYIPAASHNDLFLKARRQDRMSDHRLKRLSYRAWHRGTRELDLVLGHYVDSQLESMDEKEISALERLVECADPDLQRWIFKGEPPADEVDPGLIERIRASLATLASHTRK